MTVPEVEFPRAGETVSKIASFGNSIITDSLRDLKLAILIVSQFCFRVFWSSLS